MNTPFFTERAEEAVRVIRNWNDMAVRFAEQGNTYEAFKCALVAYQKSLTCPELDIHPQMPTEFRKLVDLDNMMRREEFFEIVRNQQPAPSASSRGWPLAVSQHLRCILILWGEGASLFELGCMLNDGPERREFYRAAQVKQNTGTFKQGEWVSLRVKYRMKGGWVFACTARGSKQDLAEGFLESFTM